MTATTRLEDIVIDARHPAGLARFRATRGHLDGWLPGPDAGPPVGLGARAPDGDIDRSVVADPEGNELCAFPAR